MKRTFFLGIFLLVFTGLFAQGTSTPNPGGLGNQSVDRDMQIFLNSNEYYPVPGDIFSLTVVAIGPGSQALLTGEGSNTYTMVLKKDYTMYVPLIGSLALKGLNYDQIREKVLDTVNRRITADFIEFRFLQPVSFQVQINGLVQKPGPVNASSIMRVSDVLLAAGGPVPGATNRRIALKRADGSERSVDFLDFQRNGRKDSNPLLLPGDKVIVGQAMKTGRIDGAVLSPGFFELVDSDRIPELVGFANGLSPKASKGPYRVVRANGSGGYSIIEVEFDKARDFELLDGDAIQVPTKNLNSDYVVIEGPFFGKPINGLEPVVAPTASLSVPAISSGGANLQSVTVPQPVRVTLPHFDGMNLYDVMDKLGGPTSYARGSIGKVYNAKGEETSSFDVMALWSSPEEGRKVILLAGDYVLVMSKNQVVSVAGEVFMPRVLPYMDKRTVREYLALSGGVKPSGVSTSFTIFDSSGGKKKAGMDYIPKPEEVILVNQNGWAAFSTWWSQPGPISTITIILGFLSTVTGIMYNLYSYIPKK